MNLIQKAWNGIFGEYQEKEVKPVISPIKEYRIGKVTNARLWFEQDGDWVITENINTGEVYAKLKD